MGGWGRGGGYRWAKKPTVEGCLSLDAARWMREGILGAGVRREGRWRWSSTRGPREERSSIGYESVCGAEGGAVRLHYTTGRGERREAVDYWVGLRTTRPNFGGLRWWFTCPLVVRGRPCGRRAGKLY